MLLDNSLHYNPVADFLIMDTFFLAELLVLSLIQFQVDAMRFQRILRLLTDLHAAAGAS